MRFFSTLVASVLGTFIALGVLLLLGSAIAAAIFATASRVGPTVGDNTVLVVELSGAIPDIVSRDPLSELLFDEKGYDLYDLKQALSRAASDPKISALWLRSRSVQASWNTLEEIRDALEDFRASGKTFIASSGEYMMSEKDYFLASAAESVYALPEAFFEFNGMYLEVLFIKGLLDKVGIEPEILRVGDFKGAVETYSRTDLSGENELQLQAVLNNFNQALISRIAAARNMPMDEIDRLAREDAMITAQNAMDAGLLDDLLFEDEVRELLSDSVRAGDNLRTVRLADYVRRFADSQRADEKIAIVYAIGTIVSGTSPPGTSVVGSKTFGDAMRRAREDDDIKAVVLHINSPGGSSVASDAMWREIHLTTQEKPVVASMGDVAASGGYWIATAADTIVAGPSSITGSIGVFGMFVSVGDAMEDHLGLTTDLVQTSPYADMLSGMRPLRPQERAVLERAIISTYDKFIDKVSVSRGIPPETVHSIGQGRIWTGEDAHELGLVDVLGGMEAAVEVAAEMAGLEDWSIRRLPRPRTFIDEFSDIMLVALQNHLALPGADILQDMIQMNGEPQARMPTDFQLH